jgi:hypothetical protein
MKPTAKDVEKAKNLVQGFALDAVKSGSFDFESLEECFAEDLAAERLSVVERIEKVLNTDGCDYIDKINEALAICEEYKRSVQ